MKRAFFYENRANLRGLPCQLLQRYNIFSPKANCVKIAIGLLHVLPHNIASAGMYIE